MSAMTEAEIERALAEAQAALAESEDALAVSARDRAHFETRAYAAEQHAFAIAAKLKESERQTDANMELLKACDQIADGIEDWPILRNLCVSTQSVSSLRDRAEAAEARIAELERALRVLIKRYESQARFADHDYAVHFREFAGCLRVALTPPTPKEAGNGG